MVQRRIHHLETKRGEVYLVNFDPTIGSEIKKTRPALIIQNDVANRFSPVTIVAAISSYDGGSSYPTEVLVEAHHGGLNTQSLVLLNQTRSIDKRRLIKKTGALPDALMIKIDRAIEISFGLISL